MIKYNKEFKFSDTYKDLSTMKLVEPLTMKSSLGEIFPVNKVPGKLISYYSGLRSNQFSNTLYKLDQGIWELLRDKKLETDEVKEYFSDNKVMIINGEIISVVNNSNYLAEFMDLINSLVESNSEFSYMYQYNDNEFQFMVLRDGPESIKVGFLIRYYLSHNWVSVINVAYDKDGAGLFTSPFKVTDKAVDSDLSIVLDPEYLSEQCEVVLEEYKTYNQRRSVKMTYSELFSRLRVDYGIRITHKAIDPVDYLADTEYNSEVSGFIQQALFEIYQGNGYEFINSPYLKRSINFSEITYGKYYKALSSLYMDGMVDLGNVVEVAEWILNRNTNYDQLN